MNRTLYVHSRTVYVHIRTKTANLVSTLLFGLTFLISKKVHYFNGLVPQDTNKKGCRFVRTRQSRGYYRPLPYCIAGNYSVSFGKGYLIFFYRDIYLYVLQFYE